MVYDMKKRQDKVLPIRHHYSWLNEWHDRQMQDPEFAAAIEELEPEYQRVREKYLVAREQDNE